MDVVWSDDSDHVYIGRKDNLYDSLKKIPLHNIRTDPSWLKERIIENQTDDLTCFHNADVFKSIIEEFIDDEWKPHCIELLQTAKEIILSALHDSIENIMPSNPFRYDKLRLSINKQCGQVLNTLFDEALGQIESHLEFEKHPYTQDSSFVETIVLSKNTILKREIEAALRLEGNNEEKEKCIVYSTQAFQEIINTVFERNQQKSIIDILAEELEYILDSYGKIVTQRVIDRSPMIAWNMFRQISSSIQELLWNASDDDLTSFMEESTESIRRYGTLKNEEEHLTKAYAMLQKISREEKIRS